MKLCAIAAAAAGVLLSRAMADCPPEGDAKNDRERQLDLLKNRSELIAMPSRVAPQITLQALLKPGDDTGRHGEDGGAQITGYVADVKPGGVESCNCHAKDLAHRDTHIYIALDANHARPRQCVIVEITPRLRRPEWAPEKIRQLILHKRVTITGWMFFDEEHKQNAVNTNSGNKNAWRATAWEIHPVTALEVLK
jgi:hypothetical protein